ncbi:MAG: cobyric acid synthase [Chloroflexi bacterium]|nr:cobyric acid synthase [Chloroflexota bacterium]
MKAKTIMVQGTASSVGKSILVAALCRILRQDGYRVAPFKAQNMALNSYVTADGGEIGRAQAVQAEAAGIAPTVDMNPILLKPEADTRSQVILLGRPYATLAAGEYYRHRTAFLDIVQESLERLRATYEVVVIEGAGSPAEINLKKDEIVNMHVAKMAASPVLLVGDIDRGGVFAALVGTLTLLDPDERALVRGLVINKFRGDLSLLQPGLALLEERSGVPVLGVIPYLHALKVAEEDSVYLEQRPSALDPPHLIDIAVIHLPHISNFDDFDPLGQEEEVKVRYVRRVADLRQPDLIIIPGTKTTIADMLHLRQTGLADRIIALAQGGTPIIGICGGYQMLGQTIQDPLGVESQGGIVAGLDLLPVNTIFQDKKLTHQVKATVNPQPGLLERAIGDEIEGYEIHMGRTSTVETRPPFTVIWRAGTSVSVPDGALDPEGHIIGTYMHGLFHNAKLRASLLQKLAERKGLDHLQWGKSIPQEEPYDRLAAVVRESLNMPLLYRICGLRDDDHV